MVLFAFKPHRWSLQENKLKLRSYNAWSSFNIYLNSSNFEILSFAQFLTLLLFSTSPFSFQSCCCCRSQCFTHFKLPLASSTQLTWFLPLPYCKQIVQEITHTMYAMWWCIVQQLSISVLEVNFLCQLVGLRIHWCWSTQSAKQHWTTFTTSVGIATH